MHIELGVDPGSHSALHAPNELSLKKQSNQARRLSSGVTT